MTKTSIKKILQHECKGAGLINGQQVKRALGWGNTRTADLLRDLDCIVSAKRKLYDVDEVADRVYMQVVKAG